MLDFRRANFAQGLADSFTFLVIELAVCAALEIDNEDSKEGIGRDPMIILASSAGSDP
jgi:hypothetical protein